MQRSYSWLNLAIIAIVVAIAFGPVFIPREISRWYLAAAANAYRIDKPELAEDYLSRAKAWDPDISREGDYWIAQMAMNNRQSDDERLALLARAVEADPRWGAKAREVSQEFAEQLDFQRAVSALKIAFGSEPPFSSVDLNQLAYYRALAGIELEQALADVEKAIALEGKAPELLDTQAWVLHSLHRDLEALPIINDAIARVEKMVGQMGTADQDAATPTGASAHSDSQGAAEDGAAAAEAATGQSTESFGLSELDGMAGAPTIDWNKIWPQLMDIQARIQSAKQRLGPVKWNVAVIRFHRLRILEALHQTALAKIDRQWLESLGVPISDAIF